MSIPTPACPNGQLYTIRAGDTLFTLASRFGTTVANILAANPGIDPNSLRVAQTICIPGISSPVPCPGGSIYTVQPGDTLFFIARRFGTTLSALIAANPGVVPERLQVGQSLCIPGVPAPFSPCCRILLPTQPFPSEQVPFTPAGSILLQAAGAGGTVVTIVESGLPVDPGEFGQFNAYAGRIIPPSPAAETFLVELGPARAFEAPVVWAGSRVLPGPLAEGTTVTVSAFNTGTGAVGNPLLRNTVGPCR